jgi:hypothetical protein
LATFWLLWPLFGYIWPLFGYIWPLFGYLYHFSAILTTFLQFWSPFGKNVGDFYGEKILPVTGTEIGLP